MGETLVLQIRKHPIAALVVSTLFFTLAFALKPNHVFADCGLNTGNPKDYAGVVIEPVWQQWGTGTYFQANDVLVQVDTVVRPGPQGGNIVNLNDGFRTYNAAFYQINSGCPTSPFGDGTNVVLGYGVTSPMWAWGPYWGEWALDCDAEIFGIGNETGFNVRGIGTPAGARTGGDWDVAYIQPPNGLTQHAFTVYHEPAPPGSPATVKGYVWRDDDGDDIRDSNEPFIQYGVNCGPSFITVAVTVTVDGVGTDSPRYCGLAPYYSISVPVSAFGRHSVYVNPPGGWTATRRGPTEVNAQSGGVYEFWFGVRPTPQPDYVVQSLTTNPSTITAGQAVSFSGIVRNQGLGGTFTTTSTRLRIDIGNNGTWDISPGYNSTTGLAANGGNELETWTNAWTSATVGTHRFEICADVLNQVPETSDYINDGSQGNNCSIAPFSVVSPNNATVQSHVFKVDGNGNYLGEVPNISLDTCNLVGNSTQTHPAPPNEGYTYFQVPQGEGYCVRIRNAPPAGFSGPYARPWGEAYRYPGEQCGPYQGPPYNYHCNTSTYEWQAAGGAYITGGATLGYGDRGSDYGYDFVYVQSALPAVSCGNVSMNPAVPEPNQSFTVTVSFNNGAGGGPMTNAAYPMRLTIQPPSVYNNTQVTYTPDPVNGGGSGSFTTVPMSYTSPGQYYVIFTVIGNGVNLTCQSGVNIPYIIVANRPYLRVYGGDVAAGIGFGTCAPNNFATIKTYNKGAAGSYAGAGAQFAAQASGAITEFTSAMLRSGTAPTPPTGLTFANTGVNTSFPILGGSFGTAPCVKDYYGSVPSNTTALGPSVNVHTLSGMYSRTSTLTIVNDGAGVANSRKVAVYVDGDVVIANNVFYTNGNSSNWSDISQIPALYLIVRGNIYIQNNVSNLDGVYIAQPRADGTGGVIYTCTIGAIPVSAVNLAGNCATKLTINGAFVANMVKFSRSNGSLASSVVSEASNSANIAEVFVYSPELWLTNPGLTSPGGSVPFQSITSLPPIL